MEKQLRKNEFEIITLLIGMIKKYKNISTIDEINDLICDTADEILDLYKYVDLPKQEKINSVKFGSYLTGHDEETIQQMFNDYMRCMK